MGAESSLGCCAGVRENGDAGGVHPYRVEIEAKKRLQVFDTGKKKMQSP